MKKLLLIIYILVIAAMPYTAYALQSNTSISAIVFVQGSFNLMVNTDSFDFARLAPGQTGLMDRSEGVTVAGASGSGNPWYIKVSAAKPLSSGSDFIPNENFGWYGSTEGTGNWYGATEKSVGDTNNTAYISSLEEADSAARVNNKFMFKLHVPEDTRPGAYTTTIMFTMTE